MENADSLIAELQECGIFGGSVEVRETHMSCVFLTPGFAFKLKKPVSFGFVDYASLRKRHRMCRKELELNRRLAPDVYLGVEPLVRRKGRLQLGGPGRVVDYLVRMRRLPDSQMLTNLVDRDLVGPGEIRAVGALVAAFHRSAERSPAHVRFGRPAAVGRNVRENFEQTASMRDDLISAAAYAEIEQYANGFIALRRPLLLQRASDGYVRDGHGDLRTDHVYLGDGIRIIDCLEFDARYRYADTISDVAFLAMDLDARNAPDLADALMAEYETTSGDDTSALLDFYRSYRAYIRGKVAGLRAASAPRVEDRLNARLEARRYFHLALRYARAERRPLVVAVSGITGAGKSTLAAALAASLPLRWCSSDLVRKSLAGLPPTEHRRSAVNSGLYSSEMSRRVYEAMLSEAVDNVQLGRSLLLDATFMRRADRLAAREVARRFGARFLLIECTVDDETARSRIDQRERDPNTASDAGWEVYLHQKQTFEPPSELAASERLAIDSTLPVETQVSLVLAHLERTGP